MKRLLVLLGACGGVYSDPKLATTESTCDQPTGSAHATPLASDVISLVVARWLHCSGPDMLGKGELGVQFLASGNYLALAPDADGNLVDMPGLDGTWDAENVDTSLVQFNWHVMPGITDFAFLMFEDEPRRFVVTFDNASGPSMFAEVP